MATKEDMLEEARCRSSFPEEERLTAENLAKEICELLYGHRPDVVMNVLTSVMVGMYLLLHKTGDLDILIERISHNYRRQTRPDGVRPS